MTTSRHALPHMAPAQASKHIIINEALERLDAAVQLSVLGEVGSPPSSPSPGDCYIVDDSAADSFSGQDGRIAAWTEGGWIFLTPRDGWLLWDVSQQRLSVYDGTEWKAVAAGSDRESLDRLGVGTAADPNSVLSVRGSSTLLTADVDSHRLYLNRTAASDAASLVFQTGFQGQAEFGLSGPGGFAVRTSADGNVWVDALQIDTASGVVSAEGLATGDQNVVVIESGSGRYTVPDGVVALTFEVQGGGGGGAGAESTLTTTTACAGGGGGGGYVRETVGTTNLDPFYDYVIGAGGSGGAAAPGAAVGTRSGAQGGQTTLTSAGLSFTAAGGKGATERAETAGLSQFEGGLGGVANGGSQNTPGQPGQGGLMDGSRGFFTGNGRGGDSQAGHGGPYANGNGRDGTGYGGGGAGAGMIPGHVLNRSGGDGAPGLLRIIEHY